MYRKMISFSNSRLHFIRMSVCTVHVFWFVLCQWHNGIFLNEMYFLTHTKTAHVAVCVLFCRSSSSRIYNCFGFFHLFVSVTEFWHAFLFRLAKVFRFLNVITMSLSVNEIRGQTAVDPIKWMQKALEMEYCSLKHCFPTSITNIHFYSLFEKLLN